MKKEVTPREGMRLINSGPVVMVSCGPVEKPNAITLAWSMNVSMDPPLVAVSIAPPRHSHELIMETGIFCVNVPGSDQLDAVMYIGTHSGRNGDKFGPAGLTPVPAKTIPTCAIGECPGHIECEVYSAVTAGDHTIFVGRINTAFVEEDLFAVKKWILSAEHGRTLHHLGDNSFGALERIIKS